MFTLLHRLLFALFRQGLAFLLVTMAAVAQESETRILKAPFPAIDEYGCHLQISMRSIKCDLALYMRSGSRRRVQFNNDDSGCMVIFEGKGSPNDIVVVDHVTLGYIEGQPRKLRVRKATGLCIPRGDRAAECHAQTVDGQVYEASIERQQRELTPKDSSQ